MLYDQDRDGMRRFFCEVWRKHRAKELLEPLERLIAELVAQHPEYQPLLTDPDRAAQVEYMPEGGSTNPFLHLGMHIAIREQLSVDRPPGMRAVHQRLCQRYGDAHRAEHQIMEALGETLWEAQRDNTLPDEQRYLERLQRLADNR